MRKVNFGKMLVAFAMLLAVGMFAACSSSDDNNSTSGGDSGKTDPTPTPTATSGTLYVYEMIVPSTLTWIDCSFALEEGKYKDFCSDSTSLSKITNATLLAQIKRHVEADNVSDLVPDDAPAMSESCPIRIDSVKLTSFPANYELKAKFAPKADFDPQGKEQDAHILRGYCFIDNLGVIRASAVDPLVIVGVKPDDFNSMCETLTEVSNFSIEVPSLNK